MEALERSNSSLREGSNSNLRENKKKKKTSSKILIFIKSCICPCIFKKVDCCNNCNLNIHVMGQ